jgi:hypothetical protein
LFAFVFLAGNQETDSILHIGERSRTCLMLSLLACEKDLSCPSQALGNQQVREDPSFLQSVSRMPFAQNRVSPARSTQLAPEQAIIICMLTKKYCRRSLKMHSCRAVDTKGKKKTWMEKKRRFHGRRLRVEQRRLFHSKTATRITGLTCVRLSRGDFFSEKWQTCVFGPSNL